jgi:Zn-dependent peptidase ImmA (M78 family)
MTNHPNRSKRPIQDAMEREANEFAMDLLMPTDLMLADLAALGGVDIEDSPAIAKLARKYRVSEQVMTIRIGQLITEGETPCSN